MTLTDRDWTSAIRGRIAGLHQRAQTVDTRHATAGRALAALDHDAAHTPGTSNNGPRSSDTPDPTHTAALRLKPPHPNELEQATLQALDTLTHYIAQLERWAADGNPNPRERRTAASPCRGGTMHMPNDKGGCMAAGCTQRWPTCTPDTVPRFEECTGTIPADSDRCSKCQMSIHSAVCRDCLEAKDRKAMRTSTRCAACVQADWRSKQAAS